MDIDNELWACTYWQHYALESEIDNDPREAVITVLYGAESGECATGSLYRWDDDIRRWVEQPELFDEIRRDYNEKSDEQRSASAVDNKTKWSLMIEGPADGTKRSHIFWSQHDSEEEANRAAEPWARRGINVEVKRGGE